MNCESCGHENIEGAHFCAKCGVALESGTDQDGFIGKLVGGRFRIHRVLGEGGMGIVYEGEQHMGSTTRRVAVKTLHEHLSRDKSVLARFHRECGTVSDLVHPNTIKFYDFGDHEGTLYIAMEFLDGPSLDKVIEEQGPMNPTRVAKIMKQICGALDEAHEKGIVHRDLKLENVVLTERLGEKDFVKVLDFGIAARSESSSAEKEAKLTQQGMVLGTPPYMSPEQFTGEALDRRSDIYSLGIMAYEMLTGQLPFSANTPWQWATEHMTAQPFPMDQVPSGAAVPRPMRDAVMSALSKLPDDRPQTAGAFCQALEAGIAGVQAAIAAPTEEMQAATFGAGPLSGSAGPSSLGGAFSSRSSTDTESNMAKSQGIEIPVKKGKGGLIAGLIVVLCALSAGAFVLKGKQEPAAEPPEPEPSASTAPEEPPPEPESKPAVEKEPEPQELEGTGGTEAPAPQPGPSPGVSPAYSCAKCISAVEAGNWSLAQAEFAKCVPASKSKCSQAAERKVSPLIAAAVKDHECKQAKSLVSEAAKVDGVSQLMRVAANKCAEAKPAPAPDPAPAPAPAPAPDPAPKPAPKPKPKKEKEKEKEE